MSDKESGDRRRRLDSVIPELLKRAVEIGVEKATEAPDNFKDLVGGMKLPREVAHYLFAQVEETKNVLVGVVAREVREFLENTNISSEMKKLLTTVEFEISTTIRFKPSEAHGVEGDNAGLTKPEVKADVRVRRTRHGHESREAESDSATLHAEDKPIERRKSHE
jgi:hypothetical protein